LSFLSTNALAADQDIDQTENPAFTEQAVENLEDETEIVSNEQVRIGGRNISAFSRAVGQTSVGGYFDTEYFFPFNSNSFFDQHRLILQASSLFNERLFFNTEIEFEHGGLLGGGTNDGELKIEQAYLDYKIEDWLIFRGGVVLIPV